jgi:hypothetical protein
MLEKDHTAFIEEETNIYNIIKKAIEVQIEESCVAFHSSSSSRRNITRDSEMDSLHLKDSNGYSINSCYKHRMTDSHKRASNPMTPLKGSAAKRENMSLSNHEYSS